MAEPSASNYPTSLDDSTTLFGDAVNLKSTTLSPGGIDAAVTTIPVVSTTGINTPCYVLVDSEIIYAPSKTATSFTSCTRGAGGSTAASHLVNAVVYVVYAANYYNQLKRAVLAIETELGIAPSAAFADVAAYLVWIRTWLAGIMQGDLVNYSLVREVNTNNLTVGLYQVGGTVAPSSTGPMYIRVREDIVTVSSLLSITLNAGTNWFNAGSAELATQEIDYFVYAGYAAAPGVFMVISRFPSARTFGDFSATTTNEKYGASAKLGAGAIGATDPVELIGRFNATLSAGAGYTWSIPATSLVVSNPIWETRWLTWTPAFTGFSANPTVLTAIYKVGRDRISLHLITGAATGTSNATNFLVTAPFNPVYAQSYAWGRGTDNGLVLASGGRVVLTAASNSMTIRPNMTSGAWTAALAKNADFFIEYPI